MTIALIDYGIGNLRSVQKALETVGAKVVQTDNAEVILDSAKVVLPGVGSFHVGISGLHQRRLIPVLEKIFRLRIPLLGICLGMQLLFEESSEMGRCVGLGFISGEVRKFPVNSLKVPQTGWNQLKTQFGSPLLIGIDKNDYVYFNHSYYCVPSQSKDTIAHTEYGIMYASAVQKGSLYGVQFHPEKSQSVGLRILKNFVEVCK